MANLTGWHLVILLGVLVLLFGAKKLPEMAQSVGQAARVLKGEMKGMQTDDARTGQPSTPGPPPHTVSQPLDTTRQAEPTQVQPPPEAHQDHPHPAGSSPVEDQPGSGTTPN